jgi:precorrin-6B methylase 2
MDFIWNEKTITWFQAASTYTGFHSRLASLVRPYIEDCATICDIGCGLGLIDLELANDVQSVVCIDQNEAAIKALNELIRSRGARNVVARVADVNELAVEKHDAVILSFFGSSVDAITHFMTFCDKRMILIVHETPSSANRVNAVSLRPKPLGADEVRGFLTERGMPFKKLSAVIEFGQPFKSLDDAKDFILVYASATSEAAGVCDAGDRGERLYDDMEKRLVETRLPNYPLYLPKPKEVAVFIVDKDTRYSI